MNAVVGVFSNDTKDSHQPGKDLLAAGENSMLRLFLLNAVVGVFSNNPMNFKASYITLVMKQRFSLFTIRFSFNSWLKKCYKIIA